MIIGPAAIFNPFFIPPRLLHREKELKVAEAFLEDGINYQYPLHLAVTGINGIGKTAFVNYLAEKIKDAYGFPKIFLNMHDSDSKYFLEKIVNDRNNSVVKNEVEYVSNGTYKDSFLVLVLDDVDPYSSLFRKVLRESKKRNMIVLASVDARTLSKKSLSNLQTHLDFILKLGIYTPSQLFDITLQRVKLAFPIEIDIDVVSYITDLVCEFDINRPSVTIEMLRRLYPLVASGMEITVEDVRKCSHDLLWILNDDLIILEALRNMKFESILLLEKVASHFSRRPKKAYLSLKELRNLYYLVCDEIEDEAAKYLFNECLEELMDSEILYRSSFNKTYFYLAIPPKLLLNLINALF